MGSLSGYEPVQATLPIANDEGVPGRRPTEEVSASLRKLMAGHGAERLARPKPDLSLGRQTLAQQTQHGVVLVTTNEHLPIDAFLSQEKLSPFAVPPVLDLGDRLVLSIGRKLAQFLLEARRSEGPLRAAEGRIEAASVAPSIAQPEPQAVNARSVVENQTQSGGHAS